METQCVVFHASLYCLLAFAGCASQPTKTMTDAVSNATKAAQVAHDSERQVVSAQLLGLVQKSSLNRGDAALPATVCLLNQQEEAVADDLGAYADSVNAVSKAATKPDDTSYSGYAAQFRKNQALIAQEPTDLQKQQLEQATLLKASESLCEKLMASDLSDGKLITNPVPAGGLAVLGVVAVVASIDQLVKSGLGALEGLQRQAAVKHVMDNAIVTMRASYGQLSERLDPSKERGPYLVYSDATSEAGNRNATRLGMVLSIQRWMLAQRLRAEWHQFAACTSDTCITDWSKWQVADTFIIDRDTYLALAATDPNKTLKALNQSIEDAARNQDSASITSILDALSSIANSISDVNNKYQAYRKTRN